MNSPNKNPQDRPSPAPAPEPTSMQAPSQNDSGNSKGKLGLIVVGAIALVGIIVGGVWYATNSNDHDRGNNSQPTAASEEQIKKSLEEIKPDWNKQAIKYARHLSEPLGTDDRDTIYNTMTEGVGFTHEQAEYGISNM
ncbi:Ltp family lipoprotein [Corynebacterium jeikeium]|uniref:Ltp family lipoprotein n=1 Tax=Corynebacterium macclintockiae TaxID=2913501 RepID=UPI0012D2E79D